MNKNYSSKIITTLFLSLIFSLSGCAVKKNTKNTDESNTNKSISDNISESSTNQDISENSNISQDSKSSNLEKYDDIIKKYKDVCELYKSGARKKGDTSALNDGYNDGNWTDILEYLDSMTEALSKDLFGFLGYALKDVNNNGVPELFLLLDDGSKKYDILAYYSLYNGKPNYIDGYYTYRCASNLDANGFFYKGGADSAFAREVGKFKLKEDGSELQQVEMLREEYVDGNEQPIYYRILERESSETSEKKEKLNDEEGSKLFEEYENICWSMENLAGFEFIPLN